MTTSRPNQSPSPLDQLDLFLSLSGSSPLDQAFLDQWFDDHQGPLLRARLIDRYLVNFGDFIEDTFRPNALRRGHLSSVMAHPLFLPIFDQAIQSSKKSNLGPDQDVKVGIDQLALCIMFIADIIVRQEFLGQGKTGLIKHHHLDDFLMVADQLFGYDPLEKSIMKQKSKVFENFNRQEKAKPPKDPVQMAFHMMSINSGQSRRQFALAMKLLDDALKPFADRHKIQSSLPPKKTSDQSPKSVKKM